MSNELNHAEEALYLLTLLGRPGIRPMNLRHCLLRYGSAERLFNLEFEPMDEVESDLAGAIAAFRGQADLDKAQATINEIRQLGARILTILSPDYPLSLSQWRSSPLVIYVMGELSRINDYSVSVVGTRSASPEGLVSARRLAQELASRGVTVLSGLAKGIDTAAHEGALDAPNGRTIAVVGTGLDQVYPRENRELQDRLLSSGGAVISQFPPRTPIQKSNFPQRNMLMSALSQGTVVVEAGPTSGARLQAEYALKQNRVVFITGHQLRLHAWAQSLALQYGSRVRVVDDVSDILGHIVGLSELGRQDAFIRDMRLALEHHD